MKNLQAGSRKPHVRKSVRMSLLLCVVVPGLLAAQPNRQPDRIGDVPLTEQTYQRLIERARAQGRDDLVEKLQSKDATVRREAARTLIQQVRNQRAGWGGAGRGQRAGQPGRLEGPGRRAAGAWRGRLGMMMLPAMTATDKYLFILRGDTVYQLSIDTLEIIKQTKLPPPEGPRPPRRRGEQPEAPKPPEAPK